VNSGRSVILHPTGADLPPDLTFEEWRDVAKIIRDIAILPPVDNLGREEREETDKAIGEFSRFLASLDQVQTPARPADACPKLPAPHDRRFDHSGVLVAAH